MKKLILVLIILVSPSSYAKNSDFYIPKTLSKEAKAVINSFKEKYRTVKNIPGKNDLKGWNNLKNKYIGYTKSLNNKVITEFSPHLNKITIDGVDVIEIIPKNWDKSKQVIIYLHGGAYTLFSAESSFYNSVPISHYSNIRLISIDYTTSPNKKWDDISNEVVRVISQLYKNGYDPDSMGVLGDSAGGGLAISSVLKLRNYGLKMPKAIALWSPWVDVTGTGDTYQTLKNAEPTFLYSSLLKNSANAYAEPQDQKNPYVSPVYGNFIKGFPSTLIQGGTKELLLSDFIRIYQKMDLSGVDVKLDLYEGLWHVFQTYYEVPESKIAITKTSQFFIQHLKK